MVTCLVVYGLVQSKNNTPPTIEATQTTNNNLPINNSASVLPKLTTSVTN